ncbi:nicotinate-nucleotide adenylyltransferase [Gallaecimonas sp. GXIMD4217]|uniref:nicotinate-nucleotide adenylyltransferase n=1 Tax=Gallaecimonas sp. GXIMD4217 TaxID=3131927 RepID=UPI00311AE51D
MSTLGLFGGTFDPIHLGHLRMAEEVREAFGLEQVSLLPNHVPPHRANPLSAPRHRLAMARLAVRDNPTLVVDDRELRRNSPSYTLLTLQELKAEAPQRGLLFIMGMDSLLSFTSWHQWQRILELCSLAVCCRPGHVLEKQQLAEPLRERLVEHPREVTGPGQICCLATTELAISATDIRARVAAGQSLRYLVPDAVAGYIDEHGLYRG